jgi:Collagen triple helix repeat (20 copies)
MAVRRIASSLSYANVVATVALFAALGGSAWAATGGLRSSSGVIHGCVSQRSHVLSVITAGRRCGRRSAALSFNAKGVPGAAGAAGPQGQPGPLGPQGVPGKNGVDGAIGRSGPQGTPGTDGKNAVSLYAWVRQDGTISASSPGVSVLNEAAGEFMVTFPLNVSACVPTASIGLNTANTFVAGSVATTPSDALDPDGIPVTTFNTVGSVAANAFDWIVTCPVS